jgi:hypothetical protein
MVVLEYKLKQGKGTCKLEINVFDCSKIQTIELM